MFRLLAFAASAHCNIACSSLLEKGSEMSCWRCSLKYKCDKINYKLTLPQSLFQESGGFGSEETELSFLTRIYMLAMIRAPKTMCYRLRFVCI